MKASRLVLFLVMGVWILGLAQPVLAAVTVARAELSGTKLRVEGSGATPNASISVDGTVMGRADGSGAFRIERDPFRSSTCVITVSDGVTSAQARLSGCTTSSPPPSTGPVTVTGVSASPNPAVGGTTATGTVRLSRAPDPGGVVVNLISDNTFLAAVPATITINPPATSGTFPVTTRTVNQTILINIAAGTTEITADTTLTLVPTAQTDIVHIQRADLSPSGGGRAKLVVEATSTNARAVLTGFFVGPGVDLGTLRNEGGGRYRGTFDVPLADGRVEVRSNFGGCAIRTVNTRTGDAPC